MSDQANNTVRVPRLGDRVQIRYHPGLKGRIIELRGPLGYKGRELYGVELEYSDHTAYIEVGADQLIYLDDGNDPDHPNPPTSN
ncbi:MAG: hypothetical protein L0241_29120 [Planctomycetia bacterium]|nr:hypothetical protein [Planctomycetia bacterium]